MMNTDYQLDLMDKACKVMERIINLDLDEKRTDLLINMVIDIIKPPIPYFVPSEYGSINCKIKQ